MRGRTFGGNSDKFMSSKTLTVDLTQKISAIKSQNNILHGQKINLEPLSQKHLSEEYVSWLNDPIVCRYNSHGNSTYTLQQAKVYIEQSKTSEHLMVYTIISNDDSKHLGNISLKTSWQNHSAEIAILIGNKNAWGKGIGTEAYQLLMDLAFTQMDLHRIWSGVASENMSMIRILEKLGFTKESMMKEALHKDGRYLDIEHWALLNPAHTEEAFRIEVLNTKKLDYGKPLYADKLQYCVRCCMPETNEGIKFDEMGICQACQSQEQKIHINWTEREQELRKILEHHKNKSGNNYDCIVPISGGKDSLFQLHVITKRYGLKPLAVTFSHNWFSETGKYNLWNSLEKLNVDHIMFTPNRELVNKLAKASLYKIGDSCWHCHSGVGAFPLQVAVKFNIPLIIWGESIAESSGRACYFEPMKFGAESLFLKISAKVPPDGMVDNQITGKDIYPFQTPPADEIKKVGIVGIHLGDYIFWDDERQMEFVRKEYGWKEDKVEGTYKRYKSVECIMPGVHDYTKFIKRGFGRGTDHASQDVRAGLLTREEGFELAKYYDSMRPEILDYYLKITGFTEEEFFKIVKSRREGKAKDLS